jgi:beta-glucanase (GH16 family)
MPFLFMKFNVKFLFVMLFVGAVNSACSSDNSGAPETVLNTNTNETENSNSNGTLKGSGNTDVIFEDNFDQTSSIPDQTKWSLCTSYISDPHISGSYDQAYVKDGKLILKGEKIGGVYKTGGIWTKDKVDFTYGKVEVCAKFNSAQGSWPAIWMMPYETDPNIPAEGEIDIMEQVNHETEVYQTLHSYYITDLQQLVPLRQASPKYNVNQFNVYAVDWTPERLTFSVNGKVSFTYPNMHLADEATKRQWPYKKPFYIILNIYLGGGWPGAINDAELPASMEVDWVRVTRTGE